MCRVLADARAGDVPAAPGRGPGPGNCPPSHSDQGRRGGQVRQGEVPGPGNQHRADAAAGPDGQFAAAAVVGCHVDDHDAFGVRAQRYRGGRRRDVCAIMVVQISLSWHTLCAARHSAAEETLYEIERNACI